MAQQVVTELVIDSSGATQGAADFTRAMEGAQNAAAQTVQSVTGISTGLAAAFGGGAIAGITAALDFIVKANKELADLNSTAKQVGLTLSQFQSLRVAGGTTGLSDSDFASGLQKSAGLLNDAQRNVNTLTQLFDANGLSIRNNNGQLISENQLLNNAANLIARAATEQDKIKIAEMLGFTKEWVPLLGQGADAMQGLAQEAIAAGTVIDDDTIKKAAEFDDAWRKSSVLWTAGMKAAAADILPIIDDLILQASKIFSKENIKAAAKPGQDAIAQVVPEALEIRWSDEGVQAAKDILAASSGSGAFAKLAEALAGFSIQAGSANSISSLYPGEPDNTAVLAKIQADKDRADDAAQDAQEAAGLAKTKIPAKEQGNDLLDRAIITLERHTAQTEADTDAVGKGAGALAEYRAETALTLAAQQNGTVVTQALRDKFQDLAQDAGDAAEALAKAKVASEINFSSQTTFLSSDDVRIAQQLKGIYGNDIPAALASTEAEALRTNEAFRSFSTSVQNDVTTALTNISTGTVSAKAGFQNLGLQVISSLEQMIIKMTIVTPLAQALQTALGGSSLFGGIFGGAASGSLAGSTSVVGAAGGLAVPTFHTGGIVGMDGGESRYIHPAYFDTAPRFHSGGIAGDEVPIVAKKGEGVFTPGQMAAMGNSGGSAVTIVNNNDFRGADPSMKAYIDSKITQSQQQLLQAIPGVVGKANRDSVNLLKK